MSIAHPLATLMLAAGCTLACDLQAQPTTAADIQGRWSSLAPEHYGSHHATRSFSISGRDWQVRYQAYADAQGRQPLFTIRVTGVYALGEASTQVPGALEGIFPALSRSLTADSDAGVQMFGSMGCRLERGKETSLVNTGCGFVPGLMQVMGEYDLVALHRGQLFFGDRTGDLSKARPDRLTPYPLVRQP